MTMSMMIDNSKIPDHLKEIKRFLGVDLTLIVFNINKATLKKWLDDAGEIQEPTKKLVMTVSVICDTLKSIPRDEAKLWLVSFSQYIYGVPAMEIHSRSTDVLMAAQYLVTRGEDGLM